MWLHGALRSLFTNTFIEIKYHMEVKHLIDLLYELAPGTKCKYVRGEDVCTFVKVDPVEQRLYTKTPLNEDFSFAQSYIVALANEIEENVPFNTSQLLNNKGSNRAVIDSIIAHTSEFYWLQKDRSKFVVWVPSAPHHTGELVEWKDIEALVQNKRTKNIGSSEPLQQIFFGAPGTGKSDTIEKIVQDVPHIRITFHPDSDYASFVGAYKPTMKRSTITKDGITTTDEKIIYRFIPQAFLKAYCEAWKQMPEPFFLIIEEINRGNCSQIFGDLFQLLDRDNNGFSKYGITADDDIGTFLCSDEKVGFVGLSNEQKEQFPDEAIWEGKELRLPSNLYIWATMNTSDQSLFPIDSAFKRRWEWKYIKIKEGKDEYGNKLDWKVNVKMDEAGNLLSWWDFIKKINEIIASMTSSADKQLGYFFCCAKNGVIDEETFVSKVIFYLWNDVFKDYGFEDASLFRYTDNDSK